MILSTTSDACEEGSTQGKRPVIDITMFWKKQNYDNPGSYHVIGSI